MKICKTCSKEFERRDTKWVRNSDFCSIKCSRKYSTKNDNKNETKIIKCIKCNKDIEVNKRTDPRKILCKECKNKYKIDNRNSKERKVIKRDDKCKYCGEKNCICKGIIKYRKLRIMIKYFGFDEKKIGTKLIIEEYENVILNLNKEYWENKYSLNDICIKYNYPYGPSNLWNILKGFNFNFRNLSKSQINAILTGKSVRSTIALFPYKQGWHITWDNKNVFLRSSYEFDYAKELDNEKISYEVEYFRILYWDSKTKTHRVAIPDFYLIDINIIVEIKSTYTYDEQNMKDKFIEYKKLGYNCKLLLEHEFVEII